MQQFFASAHAVQREGSSKLVFFDFDCHTIPIPNIT